VKDRYIAIAYMAAMVVIESAVTLPILSVIRLMTQANPFQRRLLANRDFTVGGWGIPYFL
jgi:hypothetical protein